MPTPSPETIWNLSEKEILSMLDSDTYRTTKRKVCFYAPSFVYYKTKHFCSSPNSFPTISVTGKSCALNCKHCGGKVLETMHPTLSPQMLFDLAYRLKGNGALGCLISGGCLSDGSVPLDAFIPTISRIKRDLHLTVFVHTGIISVKTAIALKEAQIDAALIDIIGSDATLKKVYNLKVSIKDYADSLKALDISELSFVPHVIVGINEGKLDGELEALKMISRAKPSALVIIAFMPIRHTEMARTLPPKPIDIAKVSIIARQMFPQTPLILGCMRPKGRSRRETDVLALKAGVDGIAFPSEQAIEYVKNNGYAISYSSYCCAQLFIDSQSPTSKQT